MDSKTITSCLKDKLLKINSCKLNIRGIFSFSGFRSGILFLVWRESEEKAAIFTSYRKISCTQSKNDSFPKYSIFNRK